MTSDVLWTSLELSAGEIRLQGPAIIIIPVALVLVFLFVRSLFWVHRDAQQRNKHGGLAVLFIVFAGWPLSLLWWKWLRPPTTDAALEPRTTDGLMERVSG